jgi:glucosyl-3-phosphoglycerate synthase
MMASSIVIERRPPVKAITQDVEAEAPVVVDDGPMVPGRSRAFHHRDFPLESLAAAKRGRRVSICLPARDESATIGPILRALLSGPVAASGLVDEVLVVDDGSTDGTADVARSAGARVVRAADVLGQHGGEPGKGQAMWSAVFASEGDVVAFLDADVTNFRPSFVAGLLGPVLTFDDVALVKAFYERPLDGQATGGGRVTELVARPLIAVLLPHLSGVVQPLAGECAAPREVLERLPFAQGYGVELGLLADVASRFGLDSIAEVDLGTRAHRNRPVSELAPQAVAIVQAALERAGVPARGQSSATLVVPGAAPQTVASGDLPPLLDVPAYARRSA